MTLVRFLIPRDERPDVKALEEQLNYMGDTVDRFYAVLGAKHWIFHERLSLDSMAELLDSAREANEAERNLIAYYKDPENLQLLIMSLHHFPAMRKRLALVQRAKEDYQARRYYATIHVLLSVMDGFVNEFETVRRGLHARSAEELDAWDSVVGHHMGLTNAHRTFTKSTGATSEAPVYELQCHGIVHGTLLNYDNDVVATKAWNRLFAVIDWAIATENAQKPPEPRPTWREVFAQLAENTRQQRANAEFAPHTLTPETEGFAEDSAVRTCQEYLDYWKRRNYGGMAGLVMHTMRKTYGSKLPGVVKQEYASHALTDYQIERADHPASAVCEIGVRLTREPDEVRSAILRWIHEGDDGQLVAASLPGTWRLVSWVPAAFLDQP